MAVRAKFKVDSVDGQHIVMSPVYTGSKENEQFFHATPGGKIELQVVIPDVAHQFEEGKEYYVDFTKAEEDKP